MLSYSRYDRYWSLQLGVTRTTESRTLHRIPFHFTLPCFAASKSLLLSAAYISRSFVFLQFLLNFFCLPSSVSTVDLFFVPHLANLENLFFGARTRFLFFLKNFLLFFFTFYFVIFFTKKNLGALKVLSSYASSFVDFLLRSRFIEI